MKVCSRFGFDVMVAIPVAKNLKRKPFEADAKLRLAVPDPYSRIGSVYSALHGLCLMNESAPTHFYHKGSSKNKPYFLPAQTTEKDGLVLRCFYMV
jgi:hypothetical protein